MADAFIRVVSLKPVKVRATAWSQKLPSLKPVPVHGYDLVDTEVLFENGGVAHIITGWHLPNAAHALTVQSSRIICTDGAIDLGIDTPGYHELTAEGIVERNPLFRNFEADGNVSGYGISRPGRLYQKILKSRKGTLSASERDTLNDLFELGFWTSVVLEAAEASLKSGQKDGRGVTRGVEMDVAGLLREKLGDAAKGYVG
jgi:hypothetical protein